MEHLIDDNSLHAYIRQLASIGYTQAEISRKLNISQFKIACYYLEDYRAGQKRYINKQMALYKQQEADKDRKDDD